MQAENLRETNDAGRRDARLDPVVFVVALLAIAAAELLRGLRVEPIIYDAGHYLGFARDIEHNGLFGFTAIHRSRTYGYPLFMRVVAAPWGLDTTEVVQRVVFYAQLAALLLTGALANRVLGRVMGRPRFGVAVFTLVVLNPFLLAYTLALTSDLLSAVLCFVATLLALPFVTTAATGTAVLAAFVAGFATMVRPANLAVLAAVLVVLVARMVGRDLRWRALPLIVLAAVVPFVPQWIANIRLDGRFHALLPDDLYGSQSLWGMELLKYATAATPTATGSIRYLNPFYEGFGTVLEFARHRPFGYATTILLHVFGMLDHDHVFVYVADLNPWYRWPAAVLNYCFLTLAVAGVAGLLVRFTAWPRRRVWAFVSILLVAGAYVAVYAPTAVESRFGLALDLLLSPFAVLAGSRVVAAVRRRQGVLPWVACLLVCVAAAAWVSAWMQRQAQEESGSAAQESTSSCYRMSRSDLR